MAIVPFQALPVIRSQLTTAQLEIQPEMRICRQQPQQAQITPLCSHKHQQHDKCAAIFCSLGDAAAGPPVVSAMHQDIDVRHSLRKVTLRRLHIALDLLALDHLAVEPRAGERDDGARLRLRAQLVAEKHDR